MSPHMPASRSLVPIWCTPYICVGPCLMLRMLSCEHNGSQNTRPFDQTQPVPFVSKGQPTGWTQCGPVHSRSGYSFQAACSRLHGRCCVKHCKLCSAIQPRLLREMQAHYLIRLPLHCHSRRAPLRTATQTTSQRLCLHLQGFLLLPGLKRLVQPMHQHPPHVSFHLIDHERSTGEESRDALV